jgi:hypothetical protein
MVPILLFLNGFSRISILDDITILLVHFKVFVIVTYSCNWSIEKETFRNNCMSPMLFKCSLFFFRFSMDFGVKNALV